MLAEAVPDPPVGQYDTPLLAQKVAPVGEDDKTIMRERLPVYGLHLCDTLDEAWDCYYQDLMKAYLYADKRMELIRNNLGKIKAGMTEYGQRHPGRKQYLVAVSRPVWMASAILEATAKRGEVVEIYILDDGHADLTGFEAVAARVLLPNKLCKFEAGGIQSAARIFDDYDISLDVAILMADAGEKDREAVNAVAKHVLCTFPATRK